MSENQNPKPVSKQTRRLLHGLLPLLILAVFWVQGIELGFWLTTFALLYSGGMFMSAAETYLNRSKGSTAEPPKEVPTINGVMTSESKRLTPISPVTWRAKDRQADICIKLGARRQQILGFGAALTGSSCAVFHRMPALKRHAIMRELFHPLQMNYNVSRVSIGSSDYSPELYSYCDGNEPDPDMKRFSIEKDKPYVLPILKEARAINRDMYLLASPWSPPGWMKPIGTMLGGYMDNKHFAAYATYFVRYLEEYEKAGVPIQAITIQNEVEADQGGKMPACTWTKELEIEFVRDHLGPALWDADFAHVGVWMIDHNYDLEQRAIDTMNDEALRQYSDSIAWHGYGGSADAVSRVRDVHPAVDHHFTEFNTFLGAPHYKTDWTFWGTQIGEAMRNWIKDYVMWNVALDEEGKPNIGPFNCGGVVTIDSKTGEITRSGGYYGLGHYSRYIKRNAWCVESTGNLEKLIHVAFTNPDGTKVLVLSNAGAERTVTIECIDNAQGIADIRIDADSVTTLFWK